MNLKTFVTLVAACAVAMGACKTGEAVRSGEATPAGDMERRDEAAEDGDPFKRGLALHRRALEILEANRDDAATAAAALDALYEERKAEIEALHRELAAVRAAFHDDSAASMEAVTKHTAEIEELNGRTNALIAEEPELMSAPAVVEAMKRLFPWIEDDDVVEGDDLGDSGGRDERAAAPDEDRPKLTEEDKALLDDMLVVQERMVEILAANMNDPDKAAAELMKLADEQREPLARFVEVQRRLEGDREAAAEFAQKHMARIVAIGEKLTEVIRANPALVTHEKVQAAMARLNGAP